MTSRVIAVNIVLKEASVWPGGRDHESVTEKVEATLRWAAIRYITNGVSFSRNVTVD